MQGAVTSSPNVARNSWRLSWLILIPNRIYFQNFLWNCCYEFIVYVMKQSILQATFGGKLRFVLTASAPISPTVLSFLRAVLGCFIFEGYGQTECTAGCTFSMPGDWSTGYTVLHSLTISHLIAPWTSVWIRLCQDTSALHCPAAGWSW